MSPFGQIHLNHKSHLDGHLDCEHTCKNTKGGKRDVGPIHNRVEHLLEKHYTCDKSTRVNPRRAFNTDHSPICGMADNGIRTSLGHPRFLATLKTRTRPQSTSFRANGGAYPYHSPTFVRVTEYSVKSEFQGKPSSAGRKSEWSFPLRSNDVLRQGELQHPGWLLEIVEHHGGTVDCRWEQRGKPLDWEYELVQ